MEAEFIDALRAIAAKDGRAIASIISEIDRTRPQQTNLSSAIRIWILRRYMQQSA